MGSKSSNDASNPTAQERAAVETALYAGFGAALAVVGTIMLLSRLEGHSPARVVNSSSHVLCGPEEASTDRADVRHTLPGLAINTMSSFFWAAVFAAALPRSSRRSVPRLITTAFGTSVLAGIVDYVLVPRRLRPGWELVLKARSVIIGLASLGAGLAAGGLMVPSEEAGKKEENV